MKQLLLNLFFLLQTFLVCAQSDLPPVQTNALTIGEQLVFYSEVLKETRKLNIYLPQGYHKDSAKTYPVIYLLDGGLDEDFIHITGLVQFASFPWINHLPPSIVVGIVNVDRKRDFTFPTDNKQDQLDFPTTGKSAQFIQFLRDEVKPLVESEFAIDSTSTLIGQSLGGLLATEILFTEPDLFNNYLIVSPSLWWNDESLLALTPIAPSKVERIFIAAGTEEGKLMQRLALALFEKLKKQHTENTVLHYQPMSHHNHADILHQAMYKAFKWMQPHEKEKTTD